MKTITRGITLVFMGYLAYMLYRYGEMVGLIVLLLTSVAIIGFMTFMAWCAVEKMRMIRAERIAREKEAHIMVVTQGPFVGIRDTSHHSGRWQVFNAPKHIMEQYTLTEPITEATTLDLLSVFTQPLQCYAIIGGQQTGKTYQARHIANYWLTQGFQPWVVGPKWDSGEWEGCQRFGGRGDMAEVERGIKAVTLEVAKRHADPRPHKDHSILPIFFDDWTPIVDAVPNARQLILEATTLYASVNILLYFILHSDTADAWGVGRKGAALKDNFVKLFIVPHYDEQGRIIRDKTTAYIHFSGETTARSVNLIKPQPARVNASTLVIDVTLDKLGPEPNEREQAILDVWDRGITDKRTISQEVYGSVGGYQYDRIERVLIKFGRV